MDKTRTETIYFYAICRDGESEIEYRASDVFMDCLPEYTLVSQKEITFALPDAKDILPRVIGRLEDKRALMRAAASAAITKVDEQIASLMALPDMSDQS